MALSRIAAEVVRSRPAARSASMLRPPLHQIHYFAAVAALGAVLFVSTVGEWDSFTGRWAGRAAELQGDNMDVAALEAQASQGLPYMAPRTKQLSMIDVVPARVQQLYGTPSINVNSGSGGFVQSMARTAPITDCSGLGCVTRVPGVPAAPGQLAQPEHILTDLPAAYPSLTAQFTTDAILPSIKPLLQRIEVHSWAASLCREPSLCNMRACRCMPSVHSPPTAEPFCIFTRVLTRVRAGRK